MRNKVKREYKNGVTYRDCIDCGTMFDEFENAQSVRCNECQIINRKRYYDKNRDKLVEGARERRKSKKRSKGKTNVIPGMIPGLYSGCSPKMKHALIEAAHGNFKPFNEL